MNWKLKAHSLAILSRVPGGRSLYHALQTRRGTDHTSVEEYIARAAEIVELIREAGQNPYRGVYLEIGTGWKPFLPFLLHLIGAERIITLDVNPWLSEMEALATFRALADLIEQTADRLGLDPTVLRKRADRVTKRASDLPSLLQACDVEYRCPADACRTGLADESIDVVCSSNVLEHVRPEVLRMIHDESMRILKPRGLIVHRFNPQDHFSTVDASITGVNFLRYSEDDWRWYGGSGFSYHNRLRCIQHRRLLEEAGARILIERVRTDGRALKALRNGEVVVHPDFARFDFEQLAADYMWCVGMKG